MQVSDRFLQKKLDAVDAARRTLAALGPRDSKFLDQIQRAMPQFEVVGNQSAGKSSLLCRVSGVQLPQAAKRCTRLPIVLQLRRDDAVRRTTVTLTGPGVHQVFSAAAAGEREMDYDTTAAGDDALDLDDDGDVAEAIAAAQDRAVELSDSDFAPGFTVEVLIRQPGIPNVSLVECVKRGS
jgi:hypothetical protein